MESMYLGSYAPFFATAAGGLTFASLQLVFRKVLKRQSIKDVMDLTIYQSLVASIAISILFLASGEWKGLKRDMEGYALGNTSYVLSHDSGLEWTAVAWQVSIFVSVVLVFELSALFANVIGGLGLPIGPIAAMIVFQDKMSGLKVISMVLAIWGVLSYGYEEYLDDHKLNAETRIGSEVSEA